MINPFRKMKHSAAISSGKLVVAALQQGALLCCTAPMSIILLRRNISKSLFLQQQTHSS
ncbi:hypothetical protein [Vogesella fluminis]|uniref:hypothetical protein n=1 Tax=Vogesella fluminis TaxID=1069161 RepID=UPI001672CF7A|nr:hypothetical protein [Vogesella fluminis]